MTDLKRHREGEHGVSKAAPEKQQEQQEQQGQSRTAGTNRDFDESGTSDNQGHGHPREERQSS
jgi:hypothetical protein